MDSGAAGLTREKAVAFLIRDGQRMESHLEAAQRRVRELEGENRGLRTDLRRAQQNARMLEQRIRLLEAAILSGEFDRGQRAAGSDTNPSADSTSAP